MAKTLFEPMRIGGLELKNRISLAPMGLAGLTTTEGGFNQRGVDFFVERAKGGVGLLITGLAKIENTIEQYKMPSNPNTGINPAHFHQLALELTERVHAYDCKILLQATLGFGRVAHPRALRSHPVAPSPIPNYWDPTVTCRELSTEEVEILIHKFGECALLARESGFDGLEVHAVHEGYLLDQFAMAMSNQRTDKYGGDLSRRLQAAVEVVQTIKNTAGKDFPVMLRYGLKSYIKGWNSGALPDEDFEEKGRDIPEGIEAAKILESAGYDAFNADGGSYESWYWAHPPMYFKHGCYLPLTEELKRHVSVPVLAAGKLETPEVAERAVAENRTDGVSLGRGLLADPLWAQKMRQKKYRSIRPCIGCHVACMNRIARGKPLSCAVNPATGREVEYSLSQALDKKRVLVVGGGIAGMEAARVAALRGHRVELHEKTNVLGGLIVPGSRPEFKVDDRRLLEWYAYTMEELEIPVHFSSEITEEKLDGLAPEVTIVATGSRPFIPPVKGKEHALGACEVLLDPEKAKGRVLVVGGGLIGCEIAYWLSLKGREVWILEALEDLMLIGDIPHPNRLMLLDLIKHHRISIRTGARLEEILPGKAIFSAKGTEQSLEADTVIFATGYRRYDTLYRQIRNQTREVHVIGDALKPENIKHAVWTAYEVARSI